MPIKYYYANLNDNDKLSLSSSGGIAYALYEKIIKAGGIAYGVKYTDDYRNAEYKRAQTISELADFRGSKYITTKKRIGNVSVFQVVFDDLSNNTPVLFIGLPCDVAALKCFLEHRGLKNLDLLITVDLICQGPLEHTVQKEYIEFLESKYGSEIVDFSVRYKNPNWLPIYLKATFRNGKQHIKPLYETDFGRAFIIMGKECCYNCKFKGENHKSDITLGDFWGLLTDEKGYNKIGTSSVIITTEKGNTFFKGLDNITYGETSGQKVLAQNAMFNTSRKRHPKFNAFKHDFTKYGLHKACFKSRNYLSRIKYLLFFCLGKKPY